MHAMRDPVAGQSSEPARRAHSTAPAPDLSTLYYRVVRSSLATTIHDETGALALFNAACSGLLGYDAAELASLPSAGILHPHDAPELAAATGRATHSPDGMSRARVRLMRKDHSAVEVDLLLTRVLVGRRRYLMVESTPVVPVASVA